ncbi:MAG: FkbM family methyltransferase [Limnothrix sp. RL_2_0]|nr:FkbM family methyltransferase [Limnothrix sp. RL_2_0]
MSKDKKKKSSRSKKTFSLPKGFAKSTSKRGLTVSSIKTTIQKGIQYYQSGQYEKAQCTFQEVIEEQKNNAEALYLFSAASSQLGEYDIAVESVQQAIDLQPNEAKYYFQLGNIFQGQGFFDEAITLFKRVVTINPNFTDVHYNLGNAYLLNRNFDQAIAAYRKNLLLNPEHYDSFNNLGHAFLALELYQESFNAFKKTIELRPQDYSGYNHIGTVFQEQEKYEEAFQYFQQAIKIEPTNPNIKYNLGNALQEQGNISDAISIYKEVLKQQPDNTKAQFNLGWSLLLSGKLPQGWEGYEYRFNASDSLPPLINSPFYAGTIKKGKKLFVWSEQGLGDSLQFVRYAVFLQQQGMEITISVNTLLIKLFENCLDVKLQIVDQNHVQISQYQDHIPLLSLPYLRQTNENNIPLDIPYIHVSSEISQKEYFSEKLKKFNIGIVWGSSLTNPKMYKNKSISLSSFLESIEYLQNLENIGIFSLQVGIDASQIQPFLDKWNNLFDLSPILDDFYDTASIIEQLDLVITVDTAVAHLAGAMGKNVWIMLPFVPDWRWQLERKDTPWYATMTLFRQNQRGDWGSVFKEINQALISLLDTVIESNFSSLQEHNQLNIAEDPFLEGLCREGENLIVEGCLDQAITIYEKVIKLQPENDEIFNLLGTLYQENFDWEKAIQYFRQAIKLSPNKAEFYFNLGNICLFQKNYAESEVAYRKAISLEPNNTGFINNLSYSLQQQAKYDEALQTVQKLLIVSPDNVDAYNHLGNIYQDQEKYPQAIQAFKKAIVLDPQNAGIQYNLGNVLQLSRDIIGALEAYQKAIDLDPQNAGFHKNLATALQYLGKLDAALIAFETAIGLQPNDPDLHSHFGMCLLLNGDFKQGWSENLWRLKTNAVVVPQTISKPLWLGEPILKKNQTILLWSEQGYGDIIQFIRYALLLHQNKIKIVVATYAPLIKLLKECLGIPIKLLDQEVSSLGRYKHHTSILNLPQIFKVDGTESFLDIPYLKLQKKIPDSLKLSAPKSSLKVGLVWAGGKANLNLYHSKSIDLESFLKGLEGLFDSKTVTFYSLQVGDDTVQIQAFIEKYNNIFNLESLLTDFYDTACVLEQLDLVITVDTAVAHLAGAMGKKVWMMLPFSPDWRWRLVGEQTHWYPSMRLFRQPKLNDWNSVFHTIHTELFSLLNLDFETHRVAEVSDSLTENSKAILDESYYFNLGQEFQEKGDIDTAIAAYEKALKIDSQNTEILNTLGNLYQECEQIELAVERFKKAVEIAPKEAGLQFNLGNALLAQKAYQEAEIAYCKAIKIDPKDTGIINNLGHVLHKQKKYDEALSTFQLIIDLRPDESDAYNHIGNIYQDLKDYPQAIKYFQQALEYKENDSGYLYNLGNAYQLNKEHKKAAITYQQVLEIDPNHAGAQYNLGNAFLDLRQLAKAVVAYKKAIEIKPDYAEAHVNLSLILLVIGKLDEGWIEYEWRFQTQQVIPPNLASQMWNGISTLENNELYLWSEQGLGDSIQFVRYGNLLKTQGIDIKLVTVKPLIRLFQECLTEKIEVIEDTEVDLTQVANHASLMSLPHILGTQEQTIPDKIPYIKINNQNLSPVLPKSQGIKIGFVWASGVANQGMYANKSVKIETFISIFQDFLNTDSVTLFSLQVGEDAAKISPWISHKNIYDLSPLINDFYDTANLIEQLDLVISVDTAVAHLAGAMGKTTWVLLPQIPDWRWQLYKENTPWYSTMRLFRQTRDNDWKSVLDNVKSNLLEIIDKDQPSQQHSIAQNSYADQSQSKKKMKKKTCLHIISYFEGSLGYNVHARELTNAIEKIVDGQDIEVLKTNIQDMSYEETANQKLRLLQDKDQDFNILNICLSVGNDTWIHLEHFPGIKIAYTVWESTKLPDSWIDPLKKCDYIWTASHWGKEILRQNGMSLDKLYVVPEGINVDIFNPQQSVNEQLWNNGQFKFFTVGKCETRKSTTELIHAFDLEFWQEPDVVLVLSCDHPFVPTFDMSAFINNLWLNNYNQFLLVQRVNSHITLAQIAAACQCGVFPTKAEGWGLPILESMALGKPTIVTNYSAVTEYSDESNAIFIDYDIAPIQDFDLKGFIRTDKNYGTWAQPNTSDLRKKMRYVYENYKVLKQKFIDSSAQVREEWSWEVSAKKMLAVVQDILVKEAKKTNSQLSPTEQYFQREIQEAENLKKLLGQHVNSIITTTRQGIFAVAPEDMYVGKALRDFGSYGDNELVLLEKLFTKESNVLIVGAHIGSLSIPIAKKCKNLIAIEANPETFELLEINLKLNNVDNCTALNIAASDKEEKLQFLLSRTNSGGSKRVPFKKESIYYYDQPNCVEIKAFALDNYLSNKKFDLIIMDIEGSEYFALKGMPEILSEAKALQIEFIPHHLRNVANIIVEDFVELLSPFFDYLFIPSRSMKVKNKEFKHILQIMFDNDESDSGIIFTK